MDHRNEIYDISWECRELFSQVQDGQSSGASSSSQTHIVIEVLRQRFDQWAAHLGVFALDAHRPNASLDARLAYSESLRDLVKHYLQLARRNLERLSSLHASNPVGDQPGQNESVIDTMSRQPSDGLNSFLVEMLQALESTIDGLYRLGLAIRQSSSATNLNQRILAFLEKRNDGTIEQMVLLRLQHRLIERIRETAIPDDHNGSQFLVGATQSLCKQLASSVAFRYFGILYRRSHESKMNLPISSATAKKKTTKPTPQPISSPSVDNETPSPEPTSSVKHTEPEPHETYLEPSDTAPSLPDSRRARQIHVVPERQKAGTPSVISIRPRNAKHPDPPKPALTGTDTPCPYCCQRHPNDKYQDSAWWHRHVEDDLKLYACISEECADPPQLFSRLDQWTEHMDKKHTKKWMQKVHRPSIWSCETGHAARHFMVEHGINGIDDHIASEHPDYADHTEMDMFKQMCQVRQIRSVDTCPVCNCAPEKLAKTRQEGAQQDADAEIRRIELIRHIADHVKEIGFMTVDYVDDEEDKGALTAENNSGGSGGKERLLMPGRWVDGEYFDAAENQKFRPEEDELVQQVPEGPQPLDEDESWYEVRGWKPNDDLNWAELKKSTLRVEGPPEIKDADAMGRHIASILAQDVVLQANVHELRVHSLVPYGVDSSTSTVSLSSPFELDEVCRMLSDAHARYGSTFYFSSRFEGITPLYAEVGADVVDIIAVSGARNLGLRPWEALEGGYVWLRDFLPASLPRSRILLYCYGQHWKRIDMSSSISREGQALLKEIAFYRTQDETTSRPILFICHSIGGLIVKQALTFAHSRPDHTDEHLRSVVYGLLLMGVPDTQSLGLCAMAIHQQYTTHCGGVHKTVRFFETRPSSTLRKNVRGIWELSGPRQVLVRQNWAAAAGPADDTTGAGNRPILLDTDHMGLVKYESPDDQRYIIVEKEVKKLANEATVEVSRRLARLSPPRTRSLDRCLESLAFDNMDDRLRSITDPMDGTCQWLFRNEAFRYWSRSPKGILCLQGNPGSGKSTLMRYILQNIRKDVSDDALVLSFFVHARGTSLQSSLLGFLRSTLHQILVHAPQALDDIVQVFQEKTSTLGSCGTDWYWTDTDLQNHLKSALHQVCEKTPVILLVDAVDEIDDAFPVSSKVLLLIDKLTSDTDGLHTIFSSRCYYADYPLAEYVISLEDHNRADIYITVRNSLHTQHVVFDFANEIVERAEGNFLWATLATKEISDRMLRGYTGRHLEEVFTMIPDELEELYRRLLRRDSAWSVERRRLLQWLCFAVRPLSFEELRWAVPIDPEETCGPLRFLKDPCSPINGDSNEARMLDMFSCGLAYAKFLGHPVIFIHQSAKQFCRLSALPELMSQPTYDTPRISHFQIALTCLRYFEAVLYERRESLGDHRLTGNYDRKSRRARAFEELVKRPRAVPESKDRAVQLQSGRYERCEMPDWPGLDTIDCNEYVLLHYAVTSWATHLALANPRDSASYSKLAEILDPTEVRGPEGPGNYVLRSWIGTHARIAPLSPLSPQRGMQLIHVVAQHGISGLLSKMLSDKGGWLRLVDLQDATMTTPLWWACDNGHETVVKMLLSTGRVDPNAPDVDGRTPLSCASEKGHIEVVRLLLAEKRVLPDLAANDGWTPFWWATAKGHLAVARMLLNRRETNPDLKDAYGQTPFLHAAEKGHEDVAKFVLGTGRIDFEARDAYGQTALSLAARNGHLGVVKLLLSIRPFFRVDSCDYSERTPLSWAAGNGHREVVKMLLATGKANPFVRDMIVGRTPLLWAVATGTEEVVSVFLESGEAHVTESTHDGETALHLAVKNTHRQRSSIVSILLQDSRIDIDKTDGMGRTALQIARSNGDEQVEHILLGHGVAVPHDGDWDLESTIWGVVDRLRSSLNSAG